MLTTRTSPNQLSEPPYVDQVHDVGNIDYIDSNGDLFINAPQKGVMVTSKDDLDLEVLANYEPGTIAYTAGYKNIWQKAADGTWPAIIEEV